VRENKLKQAKILGSFPSPDKQKHSSLLSSRLVCKEFYQTEPKFAKKYFVFILFQLPLIIACLHEQKYFWPGEQEIIDGWWLKW
jgi:hypothetical protein